MSNSGKKYSSCKEKACCMKIIANKKNIGAKWAKYLDTCKTINPCKNTVPVPPKAFTNKSSKMEKSYIAQHSHRGWRKVSWSRFKLEQKTKSFKTTTIGKSDLFYPGTTRCGKNATGNGLTPVEINNIPSNALSKSSIRCDTNDYEIIENILIE